MVAKSPDYCSASVVKRPHSANASLWATALLTGIITDFAAQAVMSGVLEGYCIAWPGIGTHFSRSYSHLGFARIQTGMTKDDVLAVLGPPLSSGTGRPAPSGWPQWRTGDLTWTYSRDSSARGGDWAWLSREVVFRDGVVVQKLKWTYHD